MIDIYRPAEIKTRFSIPPQIGRKIGEAVRNGVRLPMLLSMGIGGLPSEKLGFPALITKNNFSKLLEYFYHGGEALKYVLHPETMNFGVDIIIGKHPVIATAISQNNGASLTDPIIGGRVLIRDISGQNNFRMLIDQSSTHYSPIEINSAIAIFQGFLSALGYTSSYEGVSQIQLPGSLFWPTYSFFASRK